MLTALGAATAALWALTFCAPPSAWADDAARLRISHTLSTQSVPASAPERDLLRLEWHAGLSRAEEAATVDEMLGRLQRMAETVTQLRDLIEAMPASLPSGPARAAAPIEPAPKAAPDEPGLVRPIYLAGVAALLVALFLWRALTIPKAPTRRSPWLLMPDKAVARGKAHGTPPLDGATVVNVEDVSSGFAKKAEGAAAQATGHAAPRPAAPNLVDQRAETPPVAVPHQEPPPAAPVRADHPAPPPSDGSDRAAAEPDAHTVDQAIELAEIMLSMGLNQGAAATLLEHIQRNPRQALYHWLKLLDIYRRTDHQAEFERAAQELRRYYNVETVSWAAEADASATLEGYPHVSGRLQMCWRRPGCIAFLIRLLEDNRGGMRNGFPRAVAEEILLLLSILQASGGAEANAA